MAEPKKIERVKAGRQVVPMPEKLPAAPAPATLYEAIIQAARDPDVDVEKMRALADLQIQVEANEARKAFTRAFNALQQELPEITKDGVIDHGEGTTAKGNKKLKARFATYPNIMGICKPLLKKHGFTLSNVIEPSGDGTRINVVGYLEHIEGHSRISRFPLGIDSTGGKNNQQGWGSSQQYGMRYNAIALLNITSKAPEDHDNDGYSSGAEVVVGLTPAQAGELAVRLDDALIPEATFCARYGIDKLEDLPPKRLKEAEKAIADHKARRAAQRGSGDAA